MSLLRRRWLQMLLSGIVLLFLVERTLIATSNPNYAPSVILLGAFLVPITFVTYLYERLPSRDVSLLTLAVCFLWGGDLGTLVAGTLEYDVARALGFLPKLAIGLIEESVKLIVPLGFYFFGRYRSEAAGIVLGVATAAGFAALETMGYGFVSLLGSKGNLGVLDEVLLVRGLSSPAGHMSWTGLVCAVLWRERLKAGHATLNWRVHGAFLTAVVLHALWDTFASIRSATFVAAVLIIVVWAITGPIFGFSNTWQLVINTGTTIITFLMVFLIQNTQTRDGIAVQLKLDELIRAIEGAHNAFLDLEELSEEELARLRAHFEALARASREDLKRGLRDTGTSEFGDRSIRLSASLQRTEYMA